jgi:uncharacterized protein
MNCPKCDAPFEAVTFQEVEVDRCTQCQGLWFDSQEEQKLRALKGSEQIDVGDPQTGKKFNQIANVHCPKCKAKMLRMVDPEQPHIWYESCPVCYGLFFDAGEFTDWKETTLFDWFRDLFAKERR